MNSGAIYEEPVHPKWICKQYIYVYVCIHIFIITECICNSCSLEQTVGNAGVEQQQPNKQAKSY